MCPFPHCLNITATSMTRENACVAITTEEELTGNQLLSPSFKRKKKCERGRDGARENESTRHPMGKTS